MKLGQGHTFILNFQRETMVPRKSVTFEGIKFWFVRKMYMLSFRWQKNICHIYLIFLQVSYFTSPQTLRISYMLRATRKAPKDGGRTNHVTELRPPSDLQKRERTWRWSAIINGQWFDQSHLCNGASLKKKKKIKMEFRLLLDWRTHWELGRVVHLSRHGSSVFFRDACPVHLLHLVVCELHSFV